MLTGRTHEPIYYEEKFFQWFSKEKKLSIRSTDQFLEMLENFANNEDIINAHNNSTGPDTPISRYKLAHNQYSHLSIPSFVLWESPAGAEEWKVSPNDDDNALLIFLIQEYMHQGGIMKNKNHHEILLSKPIVNSWAYVIRRLCECILGLTSITPTAEADTNTNVNEEESSSYPSSDKSIGTAMEGISEKIQRNLVALFPKQLYQAMMEQVYLNLSSFFSTCMTTIFLKMKEYIANIVLSNTFSEDEDASRITMLLATICDHIMMKIMTLTATYYHDPNQCSIDIERENALAIADLKVWKSILLTRLDDETNDKEEEKEEDEDDRKEKEEEEVEDSDDITKQAVLDTATLTTTASTTIDINYLQDLLHQRYGGIAWMYINDAINHDPELNQVWKRIGIELLVDNTFSKKEMEKENKTLREEDNEEEEKEEEENSDEDDDEDESDDDSDDEEDDDSDVDEEDDCAVYKHETPTDRQLRRKQIKLRRQTKRYYYSLFGTTGMAVIESLSQRLPSLSSHDIMEIAMKLPLIDRFGNIKQSHHQQDVNAQSSEVDQEVQALLTTIRSATKERPIKTIRIHSETTHPFGIGATFFQIIAALIYQIYY